MILILFVGGNSKMGNEFCECEVMSSVTIGYEDDFGYWDVCCKCGKKIEDGHHYYDHYDGEDHDDNIW